MNNIKECPHCGNQNGFVFGMCVECGFNHLTNIFERITIYVDDNISEHLIQEHAKNTKDRFRRIKK